MKKLIEIIKKILPQNILKFIYNIKYQNVKYLGPYSTWENAKTDSMGWSDKKILNKVKESTLKAMINENIYERDGEILYDKNYPKNIVNFLNSKIKENDLIIDAGGSLGSLYFHIRSKLNINNLRWCVIEQPSYVELGNNLIKNKELSFYNNLNDIKQNNNSIIILSSFLQYIETPEKYIEQIEHSKFINYIIIDRLILSNSNKDVIYVQKNPKKYLNSSYPIRIFSNQNFLNYFKNFKVVLKGDSYIGNNFQLSGNQLNYCNIILSRIKSPE
tara:strand:- start:2488 stop:3306 length:819 start_codon:yes stop_codon:yes gene_type:complete